MLELPEDLGLALEPGHKAGFFGGLDGKQLESDLPVFLDVERTVNNGHPPGTKLSLEEEGTQLPFRGI
jgi:hypothetical protein